MPPPTTSLQLFGLDLRLLWQEFRASWQAAAQSRYLAWLAPAMPVRVLRADGTQALWSGSRFATEPGKGPVAEFEAVEVSDDLVLRKRLHMPNMPAAAIAQAAELEVHSAPPFAADDLTWGYSTTADLRTVEVVMASRRQVAQYVNQQGHRLALAPACEPEVWVLSSDGLPIVLSGWGEQARLRRGVQHRRVACALIVSALLIAAAMAVTPSLQLRARSLDAIVAFEGVQHEVAPVVAQRDQFTRSVERLETLRGVLAEHIDMLRLMTTLTKALPDSTYLQSVQIQGLKVSIHGLTADSAALMQTLSAVPGFKEVRAPMAATRAPGADAENFRIEAQLDPSVFALTAGAPAPDAAAQPSAVSAPPVAIATPPAQSASAAAPRKSRFTSGG